MKKYEYKLLTYTHDTLRQERVNVGAIFYSNEAKFLEFGFRDDLSSLKSLFPDLNPDFLKKYLLNLQTMIEKFATSYASDQLFQADIEKFSFELTPGAGSFEWGRRGSGISDNLEIDFQRILEKFVLQKLDKKQKRGKSDAAVLVPFKAALKKRNMLEWFSPTMLELSGFSQEVEYTFQNGVLHCLKPISFDVGTESGIFDKALKVKGWHEAVMESNEQKNYKFYYLIGKPQDANLLKHYDNAYNLLSRDKDVVLLTEDRADDLPNLINQAIIQAH